MLEIDPAHTPDDLARDLARRVRVAAEVMAGRLVRLSPQAAADLREAALDLLRAALRDAR